MTCAADWPIYGGDSPGTKYSALDQINRTNVKQLKPAWIYHCDDMTAKPASTIECNPIVIDGVAYLTTPGLKLVALDATTGKEQWRFDPWAGARGRGVNRGVTYWADGNDRRILFVAGSNLHAINAADGKPVKSYFGWMHPAAKKRRMIVETLLAVPIIVRTVTDEPSWHLRCPHCGVFTLVCVAKIPRSPPTCDR